MNKRGTALLALSLATGLAVTACGGGGNANNNNTPSTPGEGNTGGTGAKKVELRIGTWDNGDGLRQQQQIADNYMKANNNVKINIESVPDQYGTKLLTQIAGNQAPDIFQIGDGDVKMFMEKGALEDLTPYIEGNDGIDLNDYYTNVLDVGKLGDKYYTMPKDYSNLGVYYNKKLFDAANIPYPEAGWTWDDLYATAKQLTVETNGKYSQWGVELPGTWLRAIMPLINAYGGDVISPDGESFEGFMNSDGTVKALEMYQDMYLKDHIAPSNTDSAALQGVDLFAAGKVAMTITGRWPVMDYKANPDLSFGVAPMPAGPNGPANTICYAGYGLYSKSANKDEAWKYLKYLTGPEGQEIMAEFAFTAVKSTAEKLGQAEDEHLKPFLDDIDNIKDFPEKISPYFGASGAKAMQNLLDKMMLGKPLDIKAELDAAVKQSTSDLAVAKTQ